MSNYVLLSLSEDISKSLEMNAGFKRKWKTCCDPRTSSFFLTFGSKFRKNVTSFPCCWHLSLHTWSSCGARQKKRVFLTHMHACMYIHIQCGQSSGIIIFSPFPSQLMMIPFATSWYLHLFLEKGSADEFKTREEKKSREKATFFLKSVWLQGDHSWTALCEYLIIT